MQLALVSCERHETLQPLILTQKDSAEYKSRIRRALINITALQKNIRSGDLVTRTGNDFTSQSLRSLNRRNKTWSHCGIASIEKDTLFIYHAVGGEWNPDEKLRRDPWLLFADPYSNNRVGHFRFSIPANTARDLLEIVKEFHKNELPFDMDFDLATDDRMYCAEFIYKSFLKAGKGQILFNRSHINEFEFVGVDDIFLQPLCKKLAEVSYK
jgi:hypothetical protein